MSGREERKCGAMHVQQLKYAREIIAELGKVLQLVDDRGGKRAGLMDQLWVESRELTRASE